MLAPKDCLRDDPGSTKTTRVFSNAYPEAFDRQTAFRPAAIEAMSKAFDEACIALQVYAGDEKGREIIATRIVDLARNGLIDPQHYEIAS